MTLQVVKYNITYLRTISRKRNIKSNYFDYKIRKTIAEVLIQKNKS